MLVKSGIWMHDLVQSIPRLWLLVHMDCDTVADILHRQTSNLAIHMLPQILDSLLLFFEVDLAVDIPGRFRGIQKFLKSWDTLGDLFLCLTALVEGIESTLSVSFPDGLRG
jgi:hypothetical protein